VHAGTSTDSASGKKLVDLLQRLIESLQSTADYAFLPEEYEVKIAFERDIDFEVARGLLVARGLFKAAPLEVGGAEWASRAICTWASPGGQGQLIVGGGQCRGEQPFVCSCW